MIEYLWCPVNLTYIHLRLDEIFARDEWFGGVHTPFVGFILQLPPVNGAAIFERIHSKSFSNKLRSKTSVNIWQENVIYDKLTINERQKKDEVFTLSIPTVNKFEELVSKNKSPLCLFSTRKACQKFNFEVKVGL